MKEIQLVVLYFICCVCHVAFTNYPPGSQTDQTEFEFCDLLNRPIQCDPKQKYRTINGVCNNLKNPTLGAANTKIMREGKARYGDGLFSPPKSVTGNNLPSARLISLKVFDDAVIFDKKLTVATMQFGQFVAHDLASSVGSTFQPDDCCTQDGKIINANPKCFYIPVPPNDPLHGNKSCLNFIRDFTHNDIIRCIPNPTCGPSDQINKVTAYLDLSLNYGNNEFEMRTARSGEGGKLRTDTVNNQTFPPHNTINNNCFQTPDQTCFFGVDQRMNIVPQLTILHILFIREHNRLADGLKKINPLWTDEQLFQEARKICIAQYQYIVYYEWLPELLGLNNVKKEGLYFQKSGPTYSEDYNENINPSVINEFTAVAFRFFHTQIVGKLENMGENRNVLRTTRLSDLFFRPAFLTQADNFQSHCRGMTSQAAASMDQTYDAEIRSFFLRRDNPIGVDLKAIDIQRDRDHGIPTYNEMRKYAGLRTARKWNDYLDVISQQNLDKLKSVYANFEDVDLSVGGALEKPLDSSVGHGPTYNYLLMKQFYISRAGDRFWFEFNNSAGVFTPKQLEEIRKSSMSRIICDNSGGITTMQDNAFVIPNRNGVVIKKCSQLPVVNLSLWKE